MNYPLISRRPNHGFEYKGLKFSQDSFHIFAGLNAVDTARNVERTFAAISKHGLRCARMGAYKPRTSPYTFQGLGKECLPYVFDLAAKYGIKVIAMEVTHERHIEEIIEHSIQDVGVMLQIGTRNAQNFELLKAVGMQREFPILYKRGFGITLEESLAGCEYIAHAGNDKVVFCLRGMKSQFAYPHRNFVDFAHIPAIKRITSMPVCADPSHAVGGSISDIFDVTAQAIIVGANMLLVDIHPQPADALVDAKQAISVDLLDQYIQRVRDVRSAYVSIQEKSLVEA